MIFALCGDLFIALCRVEIELLICFKFVNQLIHLLYVYLTSVLLVENFEYLLILLAVQIELVLGSNILPKNLGASVGHGLYLRLLYFC